MAIVPTAVDILKADHQKFRELFEQFEKAKSEDQKEEIADEVDLELRVHSMVEEEVLYPAFKDIDEEITAESFEEHGVVEQLLNELATMDLEEEQFEAKFKVMKENVVHHLEEEEENMFPKCSKIPNYDEVSIKLAERKKELMEQLRDTDEAERATSKGGDAATAKASEKSEAVLAGKPLPGTEKPRKPASRRRSSRAKTTSSRSKTKAA